MRAGAGYVLLLSDTLPANTPHALVRRAWAPDALADARIGAILIGPGLGRDDAARSKLAVALASDRPLVIDGDALHLLDGRTFHDRKAPTILTPHGGEFVAAFGAWSGTSTWSAHGCRMIQRYTLRPARGGVNPSRVAASRNVTILLKGGVVTRHPRAAGEFAPHAARSARPSRPAQPSAERSGRR